MLPTEGFSMRAHLRLLLRLAAAAALAGPLAAGAAAKNVVVQLSGKNEVPPVQTNGAGQGTFTINDDKTISGSITTTGVPGSAAHIHLGAQGKNGPVAIPLAKSGDNGWSVAPNAKLNDDQYRAYQSGDLYVNVHTPAHPDGEIRGQLKP
jgi:hypothetical protein